MASDGDKKMGFADMLAEYDAKPSASVRVGDEITAKVVAIGSESVFVDLGAKAEGVIDRAELTEDGKLTVAIGDEVTARVAEKRSGTVVLKKKLGRGADGSAELERAYEAQIPVEGTVTAVNKGGVEIEIAGVRAFCPMSQLDLRFVEDPGAYLNQRIEVRITRFEGGRGKPNIVVSRRALLEVEQAKKSEELRATLAVGSVLNGTVSSVKDYGAFVDLGGLEGLLHVTELGYERVKHPGDVVEVGQQVRVQVIKLDKDEKGRDRISLSLKALQEDPWKDAVAGLTPGQRYAGKVTRTESYGAFVALPGDVEGLVHVSELGAGRRVQHAREVISPGAEVDVLVLSIDHDRKRVALSMKAAGEAREAEHAANYRPQAGGSLGTLGDLLANVKVKK